MNRKHFVIFPLFLVALVSSARLSIAWPYRENWPYTGILYGVLFVVLTALAVFTLRKHFIRPNSAVSAAKIGASFLLYFLSCSVFWSFGLRYLTEPQVAYSFEKATVIEKYRSSNHNYPGLSLQQENGSILKLDIPGQEEVWQEVQVGSLVSKQLGKQEITLFSETP